MREQSLAGGPPGTLFGEESMSPARRNWFQMGTFALHPPDDIDHQQPSMRCYARGRWSPDTDIYEADDGLVIIMDIAGITRDEVDIVLDGKILSVSGTRREPDIPGKLSVHRLEIDFGRFQKRFRIPDDIDENSIEARYENGFLHLRLPRCNSHSIAVG
jgi:HSP20 family protein